MSYYFRIETQDAKNPRRYIWRAQKPISEFDGALDCISYAVTCAFNKYGTLLAVGCNDGRIVFWDFLTRGIAKVILAHIHPVSSLSWSRSGHKLLSACIDNTVCIWDVSSGELDKRYRFSFPIMKAQFHPRTETMLLVCPMKHAAVIVTEGDRRLLVPLDDESDLNVVASFDRKGSYVYTGNAKGKILVMTVPELQIKASFKVTTGASNSTSIKSIEFARRGDSFLVNTSDRIIRVYDGEEVVRSGRDGEPEPKQKLQDLVNKTMWKKCVFSGDGEYICAGSARQHSLYIWEKTVGNLVKILHGTKGELLLDVVWHPVRPIVTSISSGVVSVWAQPQVENWSAFAPDFKELDENVEYEERESEFDLEDEDRSPLLHTEMQDVDEEVDVVTVEPIPAFCSSDEDVEDTNALLYLPISPDIDEPEDTLSQSEDTAPEEPVVKKSTPNECPPPKKRRTKADAAECALKDETHPLLHAKGKEKASPQPKKTLKSKSQKSVSQSEGKSSYRPKHGGRGKEKTVGDLPSWKDFEDL